VTGAERTPEQKLRQKEYRKKYRAAHPGKEAEYAREYRRLYPDRARTSWKKHRELHPVDFLVDKNQHLKYYFGITINEYMEMHNRQGGVCKICGQPETKKQRRGKSQKVTADSLHVDHDHKSGKIRGLLCNRCNHLLGEAEDSIQILASAIKYLEEAKND
jgi:hypothetical protein